MRTLLSRLKIKSSRMRTLLTRLKKLLSRIRTLLSRLRTLLSRLITLELKILLFFRPEIIIMLVGNKIDKEEDRVVTTERGQAFA